MKDLLAKIYNGSAKLLNGSNNENRLWTTIAFAVATYKFLQVGPDSPDIWVIYLTIVGLHQLSSKFIDNKIADANNDGIPDDQQVDPKAVKTPEVVDKVGKAD